VVNELHELQMETIVNHEFTLLLYALIMEGVGVRFYSTHDPQLSTDQFDSPENYALKFFVTALLLIFISVGQYVLKYMVKAIFPLKVEEFVDLCCITNISCLFFDNAFHGFYLHGKSPYGQADVSSEMLRRALDHESSGRA